MVKLLLQYGADPNEEIDSGASATAFAATPEIRVLLEAHGGDLGEYDTSWIEHNDELLTRVAANQSDPHRIGAAFAMSAHRPDLLARLLGAGLRMPAVHTSAIDSWRQESASALHLRMTKRPSTRRSKPVPKNTRTASLGEQTIGSEKPLSDVLINAGIPVVASKARCRS